MKITTRKFCLLMLSLLIMVSVFVSCEDMNAYDTDTQNTTEASFSADETETTENQSGTFSSETAFSSETTASSTEHIHAWSNWITIKTPSCTSEGISQRSCACGEVNMVKLPAEHTPYWETLKNPTIIESGIKQYICSNCKILLSEQPIPPMLTYSVNPDGTTCTITQFQSDKPEDIAIPEMIDGYRVTAIAAFAFNGSKIISVSIPKTITSIGNGAFSSCQYLKGVTFPGYVENIGTGIFEDCTALFAVWIDSNTKKINNNDFSGCNSLKLAVYEGTKDEWNAIEKGLQWNYVSVVCTEEPSNSTTETYQISLDDKGIYYCNLLDFNASTNALWAKYNTQTNKWESIIEPNTYSQPVDENAMPNAPILKSYRSYSAIRWSLTENGETIVLESTDFSIYPGVSFVLDDAHMGILPVGKESANPPKAEYIKIRIKNSSNAKQIAFGFALNHTNQGRFLAVTVTELNCDLFGKEYRSNSDEWETYVFSVSDLNMATNYKELLYNPESDIPFSRWGGLLYELLIFPFGYDTEEGKGAYPGATVEIDYVVIGSLEYVMNYRSTLE